MPRSAVAAVPLLLIPALGAVQGGFLPDAWVWSAALAAWAAALGLVLDPRAGRLRRDAWWVVAAAALALWTLASALWSVEPAQSVLEARRALVYGTVVLALVILSRRGSPRLIMLATQLGITALVLTALARYLLGPRTTLEFEGHLISEPLGYANAVGILAVMAILLSLGTAASPSRELRAASSAAVPLLALALALSGSNASWLALVAGLATTAAVDPKRRALAETAALVLPAAGAAVWVGHASELTAPGAARLSGAVVALVGGGCAAAAGLAGWWLAAPPAAATVRGRRRPAVAGVAGLAMLAALAALAVAIGGATEPRSSYYRVAWHEYLAHPLLGSGGGTFGRYWLESGPVARFGGALDAHSLYLETLAELGPLGLCLLLGFLLYPLGRVVGRRGLDAVPAAAGAAVAFLLHAGLDWDWELPAVVVAGLSCAAVVAFADADTPGIDGGPVPRAARLAALAAALLAGATAIAGARSSTQPSATPLTAEAPQSGASIHQRP